MRRRARARRGAPRGLAPRLRNEHRAVKVASVPGPADLSTPYTTGSDGSDHWVNQVCFRIAAVGLVCDNDAPSVASTEALKALVDIVLAFSPSEWRAKPRSQSLEFVDIAAAAEAMLTLGSDGEGHDGSADPAPHIVPGAIQVIIMVTNIYALRSARTACPSAPSAPHGVGTSSRWASATCRCAASPALVHSRIRTVIDVVGSSTDGAASCVAMCVDLFFRFPFNNMIHNVVTRMVLLVLGMCDVEAQQSRNLAMGNDVLGNGMDPLHGDGFDAQYGAGFGDSDAKEKAIGAYHPTMKVLYGAQMVLFDECNILERVLKTFQPDPEFEALYSSCRFVPKKLYAGTSSR